MMAGHDRIFRPSTSVTSYSSSHTWKAIKEVKQRPGDDVQGHSRGRALSLKNVQVPHTREEHSVCPVRQRALVTRSTSAEDPRLSRTSSDAPAAGSAHTSLLRTGSWPNLSLGSSPVPAWNLNPNLAMQSFSWSRKPVGERASSRAELMAMRRAPESGSKLHRMYYTS
jgi:hypothetical protein